MIEYNNVVGVISNANGLLPIAVLYHVYCSRAEWQCIFCDIIDILSIDGICDIIDIMSIDGIVQCGRQNLNNYHCGNVCCFFE